MNYSVLGLARSGVAAANALAHRGHSVLISDLRDAQALAPFLDRLHPNVEVTLGQNRLRDGDTVVTSPGLPPRAPVFADAAARGLKVIGEIALFQRLAPHTDIVCVTGTDGKSTTTNWLGEIIARARPTWVGGNIGIPLCESLSKITPQHAVVAEVSCFQLWTSTTWHPQVTVVTNLALDHLDYFDGSFDRYVAAKRLAIQNLGPGETAILSRDDALLQHWRAPAGAATWWFSHAPLPAGLHGVFIQDAHLVFRNATTERALVPLNALPLPGRHNVENAMAAAAAALAFGVPLDAVTAGLRDFAGLEHRIERVATIDGVTWYNDSKATNPHAGEAALRAFDAPITLIAGGSEKGADFSDWAKLAVSRCRHIIVNGATGPRIGDTIEAAARATGRPVALTRVQTLQEAVSAAHALAQPGGIVVLSPGCASFDQHANFEARGRTFKAMVRALTAAAPGL